MDEIIKIARKEIKEPSFGVTKQYLAVNAIELADGEYAVERIAQEDSNVVVYFKISNERYYFGVSIDKSTLEVIHTFIENGNMCYLTCTSDVLSMDQIIGFTKLTHTSGWSKGDYRKDQKSKYDFTRVNYELLQSECYETGEAINELLSILETDLSGIRNLIVNTDAYISICKHQYISGNAGLHIDVKTINRLANLQLPVDIDTYINGIEIPDE